MMIIVLYCKTSLIKLIRIKVFNDNENSDY
jgi:hypothetical protein